MIAGAHFLLYSKEPEADRAFFKTVLEFPSVDIGEGWLIFGLPPAELAVHPGEGEFVHGEHPMVGAVLHLMCDDLASVIGLLKRKGGLRHAGRSRVGNQHECSASDWRRDWPLPTDASHDD
jgi:hypothetical protein